MIHQICFPAIAICLGVLTSSAHAAGGSDPLPTGVVEFDGRNYPLKISKVSERRYQSTAGSCDVEFTCEDLGKQWILTEVDVARAVDDKSRDLRRDGSSASRINRSRDLSHIGFALHLKQTSRDATGISDLRGVLRLQRKGGDSRLIIKGFRDKPAEFFSNESLDALGVQLAYLDQDTFDDKGAELLLSVLLPRTKKKELDSLESKIVTSTVAPMKAILGTGQMLLFVVKGPTDHILRIDAVASESGEMLTLSHSLGSMYMVAVSPSLAKDKKIDASSFDELHIHVKDEKKSKPATFRVLNVPLP